MSTSGGLSRRRVGGGASSSNADDDDTAPRPVLGNSTPPSPNHHHAGSAFQGGGKIAFDPRDLQQDASEEARIGGKMPRLTIMEEVLLLGIKDKQVCVLADYKTLSSLSATNFSFSWNTENGSLDLYVVIQGYLSFWNDNISYALRGCILIELALRRRIALVRDPNRRRIPVIERIVEVIDDRQTGETILDEALKMMKAQQEVEQMSINSWIDLLSGALFRL